MSARSSLKDVRPAEAPARVFTVVEGGAEPPVGLDETSAENMRWFLCRDYEGDVGYRSGMGDLIDELSLRAVRTTPPWKPHEVDLDMLAAGRRLRAIERRWRLVPRAHQDTLRVVYSATRRALPEWGRELGSLVLYRALVVRRETRGGADVSSLVSWLAKLHQRRTDPIHREIRSDAETALRDACEAWHATWSRHVR